MRRWMSVFAALLLALWTAGAGAETVLMWNEVNGEEYGATVGAHAFEQKLAEVSGGKLTLDLYTNAAMGSEAESMQGLQMGTLDIFRGNASSLPDFGAEKIGATGLPFLFDSMEDFYTFSVSGLGQAVLESVEEAKCGFVALGWMVEGPRSIFLTKEAWEKIGSPKTIALEDLQGLVVRPGNSLIEQTLQALGMNTVPVVFSELKKSLQAGSVDGAENGITTYLDNEFYQPAPYFVPDAHVFGCGVILMSQKTWDRLSEEERGWVREAARAGSEACYAYNLEHEEACVRRLAELDVTPLEIRDLAAWRDACRPLYVRQSEEIQQLVARIQKSDY